MIVLDASAAVELILRTPSATAIEAQLFAPNETLHAPYLLDIEVAQVIRRYAARGELSAARGSAALDDFCDLPVQRYSHDILLPRIWALRNNLTAYDATYIALAEALDATLITRDARLASAAGHSARVVIP